MINKILKEGFIFTLLALAVFLLPLERLGSFDFGGITIRFSQILILFSLFLFFIKGFLNKNLKLYFSKPYLFYFIFVIFCLLSLFFAREQMRGLLILFFLIFMFFISYIYFIQIDTQKRLKLIIDIFLFSSVAICIFGFYQFIGDMAGLPNTITFLSDRYIKEVMGVTRIQSTFIEPLYFANYLLIPIFLTVFILLRKIDYQNNKKYFLYLFIFIISLFLTFSKGAILTFFIMVFFLIIFQIRSVFNRRNLPYLFLVLLIFTFLSSAVFFTLRSQPDIGKVYDNFKLVILGGSVTERREAYDVAFEAYDNNKLTGIGIGNFGPYFAGYPISAPDYGWAITNNEYLEILAETGILGLMSFIIFLVSIIYFSINYYELIHDQYLRAILLALNFALIGILIQYMTFSTLYIMHIWVLIGLILAVQKIIVTKSKIKKC